MYKNNQMKIKLHMLLIGLVLIGAVNWGTTAFGYNLVEILSSTLNKTFNSNIPINNLAYTIEDLESITDLSPQYRIKFKKYSYN